jgi:uncharacterized protein (UPF0303 family)
MTKKNKLNSMLDYLKGCKDKKEIYYFDTPNDAYNFGKRLRDNIAEEFLSKKISVDISANIVRIFVIAEEPSLVGSGCK